MVACDSEMRELRVVSCGQDGSVDAHAVDEATAARPMVPAPWPSET